MKAGAKRARAQKQFADPSQMIDVGNEYIQQKNYKRAAELFERIIEDRPPLNLMAKAHNGCGIAYVRQGNYEKAIEHLKAAIELSGYLLDGGARAYRNLGQVYELMGDMEKARENYEKAEMIERELYEYWVTGSDMLE